MLPAMGVAETAEPFLVVHADTADPAAHPTERAIMLLLACIRKLIGGGLDVFEQEPLTVDLPLTEMEHVVLTATPPPVSDPAFESLRRRSPMRRST